MDPRGTVSRIYKVDHYTLLHTKYKSSVHCGFGEEGFFYLFPIVSLRELITSVARPFFTLGAWLAEFITICFCFSHDAPVVGPVWTPGARLTGFRKRTTIHCFTQNMKSLGLVVSEKFFLCFSHC